MNDAVVVRIVAQPVIDSRRVFCDRCTHSEFVHSDVDARLCLFSECGCEGWRRLLEHDGTSRAHDRSAATLPSQLR